MNILGVNQIQRLFSKAFPVVGSAFSTVGAVVEDVAINLNILITTSWVLHVPNNSSRIVTVDSIVGERHPQWASRT